jgi:hypothetical protein
MLNRDEMMNQMLAKELQSNPIGCLDTVGKAFIFCYAKVVG